MSDVVVDSSVIAKWFVPESDSAQAHQMRADTVATGGSMFVLDLIFVEVANVLWKKHRQKLITLNEARGSLSDLMQAPLISKAAAQIGRAHV